MSPSSQGHSSPHSGFYRKKVCKLVRSSIHVQGNLDVAMTWFMLPIAFGEKRNYWTFFLAQSPFVLH